MANELTARVKEEDLPRFQFYDDGDVMDFPEPEWIIQDILPADALVQLWGPPNCGKTFLVVDMTLRIATGRNWAGRRVRQGPVVYVFGEGRSGIRQRVGAWKRRHGLPLSVRTAGGVYFLPSPVQLLQPKDVEDLLEAIDKQIPSSPAVVVLDTLARCMVGGEESSARDMGLFVAAADKIRHTTGATVFVVHHSGWEGKHERGSTALRGAADTIMRLQKKAGGLTLTCEKQKDADPFDDIVLELVQTADSCTVVVRGEASIALHKLGVGIAKSLRTLAEEFGSKGATNSDWLLARTHRYGGSRATIQRHISRLRSEGLIRAIGAGKGATYVLTAEGLTLLSVAGGISWNGSQESEADGSHKSHTPKGVGLETCPETECGEGG